MIASICKLFDIKTILLVQFIRLAISTSDCYIPGLCHGTLVDQRLANSPAACVMVGRSIDEATWVSFNGALGLCAAFKDCSELDSSEVDTISSRVDCLACNVPGVCEGVILTFKQAVSAEECLQLCQAEIGCSWFSYNADMIVCDLFESCSRLDQERVEFVSGEAGCTSSTAKENQELIWIDHFGDAKLGIYSI